MKTIWEMLSDEFKERKFSVEEFKKEVENRQRASSNTFAVSSSFPVKIKEKTIGINQVFIYAGTSNTGKIYLGFDLNVSSTNYSAILYADDIFKADNLNAEIYALAEVNNELVSSSSW